MFELFFFVNPIGGTCHECEKIAFQTMQQYNKKYNYHLIPMASMPSIIDALKNNKGNYDLNLFNQFSGDTFNAIKDFHSIKLLKGNKLAKQFVLNLQEMVNIQKCKYSEELVLQLINNFDLSAKTFKEMRQSEYVNMSIDEDLKLINTFNIKVTPTIIIYNYAKDEAGYLFEGKLEINCLKKMFQKPQPQQNKKIALSLHVLKHIT